MYSKKKLFVFHNEKAVSQIEAQQNQSHYIESLVLNNISSQKEPQNISNLYTILEDLLLKINKNPIEISQNQDISNSILSILNEVT